MSALVMLLHRVVQRTLSCGLHTAASVVSPASAAFKGVDGACPLVGVRFGGVDSPLVGVRLDHGESDRLLWDFMLYLRYK